MKRFGLWNLPNSVTWLRVGLSVPVILLLVEGSRVSLWIVLVLMFVAEISDGVDGYLARRTGQVTAVGKILDPMADSIYRICVFTALVANHWMPVWMFLVIIWRDISVAYLRVVAEQFITTMAARQSGKWKAVAQGIAQGAVVLAYAWFGVDLPGGVDMALWAVLLMATAVTAYSFSDYAWAVLKGLKEGAGAHAA